MTAVTRSKEREQFLMDLLTTAVEGGIGYWSRVYDRERTEDLDWTKIQILDFESLEDPPTDNFGFMDWAALDPVVEQGNDSSVMRHVYTVDLDAVEAAVTKICTEGVKGLHPSNAAQLMVANQTNGEDGDFDAWAGDWVVQVACFGEVVYS